MLLEFFRLKTRRARAEASMMLAVALTGAAVQAALAADGYVLTQRSTKMGDQYVYVSGEGLKIRNPKVGFNIVTRAPNWDITLFNEKTHCYYETTADRYRQQLQGRSPDGDFKGANWAKAGESNISGLKATEFRMGPKTVRTKTKSGAIVSKNLSGAQYWVAADLPIPAKLTDLLAAAYGLPLQTSACVPLRLKYNEGAGDHTVLETYRVDKSPIPVSYFDRPQNYKLVTSDAEVMMDDEQKQIMNDMAREMSDPKDAQLKNKLDAVRTGNAAPSSTFTKDDVSKLLDIFGKKK